MPLIPWGNWDIDNYPNKWYSQDSNPGKSYFVHCARQFHSSKKGSLASFINHSTYGFNVMHFTNIQRNSTSFTPTYQAIVETYKNIQPHLSNMICFS